MARKRLTTRFIDSITPPERGRAEYWDEAVPGFGLRVSDANRRSWVLMYRLKGDQKRWTFGTYPAMALATARFVNRICGVDFTNSAQLSSCGSFSFVAVISG